MSQPTVISLLSDTETPLSLFHKISQKEPTAFLLDSTDGDTRLARFSFIGFAPRKTVRFQDYLATLRDHITGLVHQIPFTNPLDILREYLEVPEAALSPTLLETFPFTGGWVGYMGYAATRYFDNIPQQQDDPHQVPEGYYGLYDTLIMFDHLYHRITFLSFREKAQAEALWRQVERLIETGAKFKTIYRDYDVTEDEIFEGVSGPFTQKSFCERVLAAKEYILSGDIFQIVLSHRFSLPITCHPLDVFRIIEAINPSPYAYYLKFPEFVYLGSSPETFVTCRDNQVVLRALAGTRPRGLTHEEDLALAEELVQNEKELAEHHMLVDLARNDLGRVCRVGSIEVGQIAMVTRYSHVMHLSTEVAGMLRPGLTSYDIFKSCFPRGTVSGAPKIRAMQLLSQLEPERRGVYSGVVGYFDHQGNMDGAIAIRSALVKDGFAHVNAGAGIVYDSDPLAEYQETRNKAKSILKAIQLAERADRHGYCYTG